MSAAESIRQAFGEQHRLTPRDRRVIGLLAEHRVLTADQLTRLVFDNPTTARHRLATLATRGVLARFRHAPRSGTQPWRYVLGTLGAVLHAAAAGANLPTPSRAAQRALSLAASPRLAHLLEVNEFFVQLAHYARTHRGTTLAQWWPEHHATHLCGSIARPDGGGEWHEHPPTRPYSDPASGTDSDGAGRRVTFWVELDRGTEPLPRLVDKLTAYHQLADAGLSHPVLIVVPTGLREHHFHRHPRVAAAESSGALVVASATAEHMTAAGLSPADRVWRRPGAPHRLRLADLAPSHQGPRHDPHV